jgi:hypothetical protein
MLILHSLQPYYNVNSTFVNTKMLAIFNKIYHKKSTPKTRCIPYLANLYATFLAKITDLFFTVFKFLSN